MVSSGAKISSSYVARIFRNWRWSWKKPSTQQIQKFTTENIEYYSQWVVLIPTLPFHRLKFCDEAHFVSRHLYRSRMIGPQGSQLYGLNQQALSDSISLTLLINPASPAIPFYFHIRAESNTEWDFLLFILSAIEEGHLIKGDFFIVDNATIHFGGETWQMMVDIFNDFEINYIFLPKYSPELNPCELVFAYLKRYIRDHRTPVTPFHHLLLLALAELPYRHVLSFYDRCINIQERILPQ